MRRCEGCHKEIFLETIGVLVVATSDEVLHPWELCKECNEKTMKFIREIPKGVIS